MALIITESHHHHHHHHHHQIIRWLETVRFKEAGDLKKMDDNLEHILALKDRSGEDGAWSDDRVDW